MRPNPLEIQKGLFCLALVALSSFAQAYDSYSATWNTKYGSSNSETNAAPCKLCHTTGSGGALWNGYGWAIRGASGASLTARMQNIESLNSDGDPSGSPNIDEINANTQPGWTVGASNAIYNAGGLISNTTTAPAGITGNLDIPTITYTVGGAISGLTGSVTLQNNAGDNLTRNVNGVFTFATAMLDGSNYAVTVLTQPEGQTCSVTSGTGTIASANVTSIAVQCVTIPTSAWPVSPLSIQEPEGTVVQISYTVQQSDWVVPNDYWLNQCANNGTDNATWVFVFYLEPYSGSATFEQTEPPSADVHLLAGNTVYGSSRWYYCSNQATPPTVTNTTFFKISLLNDNLVEQPEYASINLYLDDAGFNKIYHGTLNITVQDATEPNANVCSSFSLACDGKKHLSSITETDCDDSPRGIGYLAEIKTFEGFEGEPVVIHADWDMDGYLILEAPDGYLVPDDDYTGLFDSRIETVLRLTGIYKIWATTYNWATTGDYEIYASCPSRPVESLIFRSGFEGTVVNKPPTANAGTDQVVYGGGSYPATLVGERSTDEDGSIVSVTWTQLSGPTALLGTKSGFNQDYYLPNLITEIALVFELTVQDNDGETDTDTVTITVIPSQINFRLETDHTLPGVPNLLLFDPDGSLLTSTSGSVIDMDFLAGAGVIYAVATAPSPVNMVLTVTRPDGLVLSSAISTTLLNDLNLPFLTGDDFADDPARYLVFARSDSFGSFPLHPQIIEIALGHPDPGLRDSDRFLSFLNQSSSRFQENEASAEAYYRAVDPDNSRTTLDDWLQVTGFEDSGADAHAVYKNDADLGFGRDMYMRQNSDGSIASYVRNFPSLEHAAANENLIATVAMEYSPASGHPEKFTKFFVFGPNGERLLSADLDGRGEKPVPGVCNVCHGGTPKVTFDDGSGVLTYPDYGDTNAQFLPWDLDTFVFSTEPGLTRADQEQQLYHLNQLAKATYPADPNAVSGYRWSGATATELVNGWYNGGQVYDGSFVPPGWTGQEQLYREVVGPNCRACHVTRGTAVQNSIDFSTYDKFIAYAPLIRELVYNQPEMPLAVRTFGHFWDGKENSAAAKLAAVLPPEYELLLPDGDTRKPGRPIARTGMAMAQPPEVVLVQDDPQGIVLDGGDSLFAKSQDWRVVSTTFTAEEVTALGDYAVTKSAQGDEGTQFRLARQIAPPAAVKRTLFSRTELGNTGFFSASIDIELRNRCSGCHSAGGVLNIPVYFDIADPDDQYQAVLDLVNFEQPSQSLILTKSGGLRHGANASNTVYGSARPDFEYFGTDGDILPMSNRGSLAQLISRWIQAGAPE